MTVLLGNDVVADTLELSNLSNPNQAMIKTFTAIASGNADEAVLNIVDVGDTLKIILYDSNGNLLSQGEIVSSVDGDNTVALSPVVALVAGNDYRLGFHVLSYTAGRGTGVSEAYERNTVNTYPTVPDPWVSEGTVTTSVTLRLFVRSITPPSSRSITNIDTDNNVQVGQSNITVTTVGMDASPTISTATLGGESLTVVSAGATSWTVSVPLHIDLEWGSTTNDLVLTDNTGSVTLNNVALSAPTGWETVTFNGGVPDAGTTESLYEEAIADLGFTGAVNDIYAWETQPGLSYDAQTVPLIYPPTTVTFNYKVWDSSVGTWSALSSGTWTDAGSPTFNVGNISYAMRQMARRLVFHSRLIEESKGQYEQELLNSAITALGGTALTEPVGAPSSAIGYTGTQTVEEFNKRLTRALASDDKAAVITSITDALTNVGWT